MNQVIEQRIAEIKDKSEFGRVVRVQANTVHDLIADIRFLLDQLQQTREELEQVRASAKNWNEAAEGWEKQTESLRAELSAKDIALGDIADYQHRWSKSPITEVQKIARSIISQYKGDPQ